MSNLAEQTGPITANGTYWLSAPPGQEMLLDVDGEWCGATVTPVCRTVAGGAAPVRDAGGTVITANSAETFRVTVGKRGEIGIMVKSAKPETALRVGWIPVNRGLASPCCGETPPLE